MAEIAYISCVSESKQLYLFTNCGRWQIVYTNLWPAFGLHSPAQSDKYFQINAWSAQTIRDRILEPSYSSGEHGEQEGEKGGRDGGIGPVLVPESRVGDRWLCAHAHRAFTHQPPHARARSVHGVPHLHSDAEICFVLSGIAPFSLRCLRR